MKPATGLTRNNTPNNLPVRRINAVLGCLIGVLLCNFAAGWLLWRGAADGASAWTVLLLSAGALAGLTAVLYLLSRRALVAPIHSIAEWASRIRQGDFSARLVADHSGLYALTDDINRLAEWLESLAELKDRELRAQGARLRTQTHLVRLLYDIAGDFSHTTTADALLARTVQQMAAVLEARRIEFHRLEGNDGGADGSESFVQVAAWDEGEGGAGATAGAECVKIPLRLSNPSHKTQGECRIWFAAERFPLADEFSQLLYTLGRNVGMALERIDLHAQSARLSRMRERTHLANELHDSLAQTIAGLRFQVRVLDDLLHQPDEHAAWRQLNNVENMLEEANAELRSLIGYFRGPIESMAPGGLHPAIQAAVTRFRSEAKIPLFFQEQWGQVDVPEAWQREIVRIIQEALNNVRKHSRAANARLLLRRDADGGYTALVEDDGVGTTAPSTGTDAAHADNPGEHIGLSVMAQRAKSIGARFQVESEPGEGTRILLSFTSPQVSPQAPAKLAQPGPLQ